MSKNVNALIVAMTEIAANLTASLATLAPDDPLRREIEASIAKTMQAAASIPLVVTTLPAPAVQPPSIMYQMFTEYRDVVDMALPRPDMMTLITLADRIGFYNRSGKSAEQLLQRHQYQSKNPVMDYFIYVAKITEQGHTESNMCWTIVDVNGMAWISFSPRNSAMNVHTPAMECAAKVVLGRGDGSCVAGKYTVKIVSVSMVSLRHFNSSAKVPYAPAGDEGCDLYNDLAAKFDELIAASMANKISATLFKTNIKTVGKGGRKELAKVPILSTRFVPVGI